MEKTSKWFAFLVYLAFILAFHTVIVNFWKNFLVNVVLISFVISNLLLIPLIYKKEKIIFELTLGVNFIYLIFLAAINNILGIVLIFPTLILQYFWNPKKEDLYDFLGKCFGVGNSALGFTILIGLFITFYNNPEKISIIEQEFVKIYNDYFTNVIIEIFKSNINTGFNLEFTDEDVEKILSEYPEYNKLPEEQKQLIKSQYKKLLNSISEKLNSEINKEYLKNYLKNLEKVIREQFNLAKLIGLLKEKGYDLYYKLATLIISFIYTFIFQIIYMFFGIYRIILGFLIKDFL